MADSYDRDAYNCLVIAVLSKRQIIGVYKRITAGGILQTVILDN